MVLTVSISLIDGNGQEVTKGQFVEIAQRIGELEPLLHQRFKSCLRHYKKQPYSRIVRRLQRKRGGFLGSDGIELLDLLEAVEDASLTVRVSKHPAKEIVNGGSVWSPRSC